MSRRKSPYSWIEPDNAKQLRWARNYVQERIKIDGFLISLIELPGLLESLPAPRTRSSRSWNDRMRQAWYQQNYMTKQPQKEVGRARVTLSTASLKQLDALTKVSKKSRLEVVAELINHEHSAASKIKEELRRAQKTNSKKLRMALKDNDFLMRKLDEAHRELSLFKAAHKYHPPFDEPGVQETADKIYQETMEELRKEANIGIRLMRLFSTASDGARTSTLHTPEA